MDSRPTAFQYRPLEGNEIRLAELLPGNYSDAICLRIIHINFDPPEPAVSSPVMTLAELQRTLPSGWQAFRRPEGDYFFFDLSSHQGPFNKHPAGIDPALYMVTPPHDVERTYFEALSYAWGSPEHVTNARVTSSDAGEKDNTMQELPIRQNLDDALRSLRFPDRSRTLWIDAVCIDQGNLAEREAQLVRMNSIYSMAPNVVVWLGPSSDDSAVALRLLQHIGRQIDISDDHCIFSAIGASELSWWRLELPMQLTVAQYRALTNLFSRSWFWRLWARQEILLATTATIKCGADEISWFFLRRAFAALYGRAGLPDTLDSVVKVVTFNHFGAGCRTIYSLIEVFQTQQCSNPSDKVYGALGLLGPRFRASLKPSYTLPTADVYKDAFLKYSKLVGRLDLLTLCSATSPFVSAPSWVPNWDVAPEQELKIMRGFQAAGMSKAVFRYSDPDTLEVTGVKCGAVKAAFHPPPRGSNLGQRLRELHPNDAATYHRYPNGETRLEAWYQTIRVGNLIERFPDTRQPTRNEFRECLRGVMNGTYIIAAYASWLKNTLANMTFVEFDSGYYGFVEGRVQHGDIVCVALGCWTPLLLRPCVKDDYRVVGRCYIYGLMDGEAILGELPKPWWVQQHADRDFFTARYVNSATGEVTANDPRLKPLDSKWRRISRERTLDDPMFSECLQNTVTGETVESDPRLSLEALEAMGVNLEIFRLV